MARSSFATLAISLLLVLDNSCQILGQIQPPNSSNFSALLQQFGANFFESTLLQPAVNSPLRVPSALIQPPIDDARYYLNFAYAAYCSPQSIESFTCSTCLEAGPDNRVTAFIEDPKLNTRAFVAINDVKQEIIVSFRGSLNVGNFVADALLVPVDNKGADGVKLHQGFYLSVKSIYPQVLAAVKNLTSVKSNYAIKLTGHSLGGAEAIIAAYLFKVNNEFPESLLSIFTYGQPRVGNQAFADYINSLPIPFARVVQRADIAVHGIPAILGYMHTQNELFINTLEDIRYCNTSIYEDPTCSNQFGPLYTPVDHLYYYDIPISTCIENDPYSFGIQFLLPLRKFLPLIPYALLPKPLPAFVITQVITPLILALNG